MHSFRAVNPKPLLLLRSFPCVKPEPSLLQLKPITSVPTVIPFLPYFLFFKGGQEEQFIPFHFAEDFDELGDIYVSSHIPL